MIVYGFTRDEQGFIEIEKFLKELSDLGNTAKKYRYIAITENIVLVLDDYRKTYGYLPTMALLDDKGEATEIVGGACCFCKIGENGKIVDMKTSDLMILKNRVTLLGEATTALIKLYTYKASGLLESNIFSDDIQEAIEICDKAYFQKGEAEDLLNEILRFWPEMDKDFGKVKFSDNERAWYVE